MSRPCPRSDGTNPPPRDREVFKEVTEYDEMRVRKKGEEKVEMSFSDPHRDARVSCPKCERKVFRSKLNRHKRNCDGRAMEEDE